MDGLSVPFSDNNITQSNENVKLLSVNTSNMQNSENNSKSLFEPKRNKVF